jgi:hypothetical protein
MDHCLLEESFAAKRNDVDTRFARRVEEGP